MFGSGAVSAAVNNHIKPGDIVTRRKLGFWGHFWIHWAVYVSDEPPEIIERTDIGIRQISFERFQKGHPFTVITYKGDEPRQTVVDRALAFKDDKDFKALTNNCEQFAVYCQTGKKKSWQIRKSLALIFLTAVFFLIVIYQLLF
jgi:hypothetical protein